MRGHLTEKTDVFAFGVVTLEIISGRPNSDSSLDEEMMYLLEWVCTTFRCSNLFHCFLIFELIIWFLALIFNPEMNLI